MLVFLLIFFKSGKIIPVFGFFFSITNLSLIGRYLSKVFLLKRFSYVLIFLLLNWELLHSKFCFIFLISLFSFEFFIIFSLVFSLLVGPLFFGIIFLNYHYCFSHFHFLFHFLYLYCFFPRLLLQLLH